MLLLLLSLLGFCEIDGGCIMVGFTLSDGMSDPGCNMAAPGTANLVVVVSPRVYNDTNFRYFEIAGGEVAPSPFWVDKASSCEWGGDWVLCRCFGAVVVVVV